jgi:hypothetical protein
MALPKFAKALTAALALTPALALLPLAAEAQSFRCVGKDNKKYYGSMVPPECIGRPVEQLNNRGIVIKRIDPEGEERARAAQEAAAEQKRKDEAAAKETSRRNHALLATYTSEKDIDEARARALTDNEKAVSEAQARIESIKKRHAGYVKELDFYKGDKKPPAKLGDDLQNAEVDLKAQENLLAAKQKEFDVINTKYNEDKKRYLELTGRGPAADGRAARRH